MVKCAYAAYINMADDMVRIEMNLDFVKLFILHFKSLFEVVLTYQIWGNPMCSSTSQLSVGIP
jgi:hypothetical protein